MRIYDAKALAALLASILVMVLMPFHGALAQAAADASEPLSTGGLNMVVVTARKFAENSQSAPISLTTLSSEQLNRYDVSSLEQVAATTPQLQISRTPTGAGAEIALRGIGSAFSSVGIAPSVAVDVDEVYYDSGHILNEGLFDVSQVEILKGPQALLYGTNATAGVISVTTANPTDTFQAMSRVGYEIKSKTPKFEGFVSGPLSGTLKARLAVQASDMFGGYYENHAATEVLPIFDAATGAVTLHTATPADHGENTPHEKQFLGRLTLEWTPIEHLVARLKLSGDGDQSNNPGWNSVPVCAGATMELSPSTLCTRSFVTYTNNMPAGFAANYPYIESGGSPYNRYHSYSGTATADYTLPDVTITSITNYNYYRNSNLSDWNGESPFIAVGGGGWGTQVARSHGVSTEFRALTTFDGPLNVMGGFYYRNSRFKYDETVSFEGLADSSAPPGRAYAAAEKSSFTNGESYAGYAQILWKILPTLEVDAGARFTHETKDSLFIQPYANALLNPIIYIPNVPVTATQMWNNWSPAATITWRPRSNITAYTSYKTGYKSGGFSNSSTYGEHTPPGGLAFGPETAQGFEAGVKTIWFDRQFLLNIDAYYTKYRDLQIDFWNSIVNAFVTTNAGAAKNKGFEVESRWAPRAMPGFNLHANVNYNVARYSSFDGPCYTGQTQAEGCTLTGPLGALFQNLSGRPTQNSPLWTASLGANYNYPVSADYIWGVSVDGRYSDRYNYSTVDDPLAWQSGYVFLDASTRISTDDGKWELAVIGKNLTNRFFFNAEWSTTNTGSGTGAASGRGVEADLVGFGNIPRTIELQLTWRH